MAKSNTDNSNVIKMTLADGAVIEGTAESLIEMTKMMNGEDLEVGAKEVDTDLPAGTVVKLKRETKKPYRVIRGRDQHVDSTKFGKAYRFTTGTWASESGFEVIEPIEGEPQPGDKVIVSDDKHTDDLYVNGDVLTVERLISENPDGDHIWRTKEKTPGLYRSEFTIISRESAEDKALRERRELFEANGRELDEFKEGDVVRHPKYYTTTHVGSSEIGHYNGIYFSDKKDYASPFEVIPVVFAEDRLDKKEEI